PCLGTGRPGRDFLGELPEQDTRKMSVWRAMWQEPDRSRTLADDLRSLRRAWRYGSRYRGLLVVYIAMTAAEALVQVLPALIVKRLIDHSLPARDTREL